MITSGLFGWVIYPTISALLHTVNLLFRPENIPPVTEVAGSGVGLNLKISFSNWAVRMVFNGWQVWEHQG